MKKTLAIVLMLALCFSAFAQGSKEAAPAAEAALKVGMVTDSGTIDDRSFNQGTYEGIKKAADELGLECTYLRPIGTTTADYVTAITDLYDQGYRFIGCPGYLFQEAVTETQAMFPDLMLVIIDSEPFEPSDNTVAIYFKEEQSGFLAGVATALQLKDASVGFVGGIEIPAVQKFNWGFQQGITYANENYGTTIEMDPSNFVYSGSFADIALGQQLANTMYSKGVDAVFAAAGATGVGVINEAKNRRLAGEDVWAIGVDVDQYTVGDMGNGESCILTSAMKNVVEAAYQQTIAAANGTFKGQTITLSAAEHAVGIPADNPNLDDSVEAEVAKVEALVADGTIVVQDTADGLIK